LSSLPDFRKSMAARAIARAFTPPPTNPLWEWADENVILENEDSAEPGHYRSAKTPWTRRLQDLMLSREMWVWNSRANAYEKVPVQEISVQKSSQSGFSEACLNGIRWRAVYRPCNVIYAIDSEKEARKIASRLLRSLKYLDRSIFSGDPDDLQSLSLALRGMTVLFYGSFSPGSFANKQAPLLISDELEEHGKTAGDTTTRRNLASRKKTSTRGLQVNLSKPKLAGGPINKAFEEGNQEHCYVPCPHCNLRQPLTFFPEEFDSPFSGEYIDVTDEQTGKVTTLPVPLPLGQVRKVTTGKIVFDHCKDLVQEWDKLRILRETYFECAGCKGAIHEGRHKRWMLDRLLWVSQSLAGTPGFVSQLISDLYSEDELSTWGQIALDYLNAKKAGLEELQGFYNHRLGKAWKEEANGTQEKDILDNVAGRSLYIVDAPDSEGQPRRHVFHDRASAERTVARTNLPESSIITSFCPPYKRGTLPWRPLSRNDSEPGAMFLGGDVGGANAPWVVIAIAPNGEDVAVIEWGIEVGPFEVLNGVVRAKDWTDPQGAKHRIHKAFEDCRYRTEDVYKAAIASNNVLIPCHGIGGAAAVGVKLFEYGSASYGRTNLRKLSFNKQRAHDAFYRDRIKLKRKRVFFPMDVKESPDFILQLTAEYQVEKKGRLVWSDEPLWENHFGDALENALVGFDWLKSRAR
jgi:hypothetical protein